MHQGILDDHFTISVQGNQINNIPFDASASHLKNWDHQVVLKMYPCSRFKITWLAEMVWICHPQMAEFYAGSVEIDNSSNLGDDMIGYTVEGLIPRMLYHFKLAYAMGQTMHMVQHYFPHVMH
jgi:hypothetical protein